MARQDGFFKGEFFGLPAPMTRVPFGQECPYRDAVGLTEALAHLVVALVAAEVTGLAPVTMLEIEGVIDFTARNTACGLLERSGWIICEGRNSENRKLWRATPRAWRELGLEGWTFWYGPAVARQEAA